MHFLKKKEIPAETAAHKLIESCQSEIEKAMALPDAVERYDRLLALEMTAKDLVKELAAEGDKRAGRMSVGAAILATGAAMGCLVVTVGTAAAAAGVSLIYVGIMGGLGSLYVGAATADMTVQDVSEGWQERTGHLTTKLTAMADSLSQQRENILAQMALAEFKESSRREDLAQQFSAFGDRRAAAFLSVAQAGEEAKDSSATPTRPIVPKFRL